MLNIYETSVVRRSKSVSLLVSVAVHVALVLVLYQVRTVGPRLVNYAVTQLYLPAAAAPPANSPPVPPPIVAHPPPGRLIAPPSAAVLAVLPPSQPRPELAAPPELAVAHPAPLPVRQPVLPSLAPAAPSPPPPVFASALPATASAPPAATPRTGAFGAMPSTAPVASSKLQLSTGSFGTVPAEHPDTLHPATSNTATGASGFGSAAVASSTPRREPSVGPSNRFGGVGTAAPAAPQSKPLTRPASPGFDSTVAADPARHAASPPKPAGEALEILYKPRPLYTEEARRARVEGDVVLEVLFPGSGNLRVLRLIRGLGFGLDQNALDAAAKVRFRPAFENGHPVDTVAMLRISFQVAY